MPHPCNVLELLQYPQKKEQIKQIQKLHPSNNSKKRRWQVAGYPDPDTQTLTALVPQSYMAICSVFFPVLPFSSVRSANYSKNLIICYAWGAHRSQIIRFLDM